MEAQSVVDRMIIKYSTSSMESSGPSLRSNSLREDYAMTTSGV